MRLKRLYRKSVILVGLVALVMPVPAAGAVLQGPESTCDGVPATIVGTELDDDLEGTAAPDIIVGLGGADTIDAGGGKDVICGGTGTDHIDAAGGPDTVVEPDDDPSRDVIMGGAGIDHLYGGDGNDTLRGEANKDHLSGDLGDDRMFGGDGEDTLEDLEGNDRYDGGDKDDVLIETVLSDIAPNSYIGGPGEDHIHGGAGQDHIEAGKDNDEVQGGPFLDTILGGPGIDKLYGEGGSDTVVGGPDRDRLEGGEGNDVLNGDENNDKLFGQADEDLVTGGDGIDLIDGGPENDHLFGLGNKDEMYGRGGDDNISGAGGNDRMWGGDDTDKCVGGQGGDDFCHGGAPGPDRPRPSDPDTCDKTVERKRSCWGKPVPRGYRGTFTGSQSAGQLDMEWEGTVTLELTENPANPDYCCIYEVVGGSVTYKADFTDNSQYLNCTGKSQGTFTMFDKVQENALNTLPEEEPIPYDLSIEWGPNDLPSLNFAMTCPDGHSYNTDAGVPDRVVISDPFEAKTSDINLISGIYAESSNVELAWGWDLSAATP